MLSDIDIIVGCHDRKAPRQLIAGWSCEAPGDRDGVGAEFIVNVILVVEIPGDADEAADEAGAIEPVEFDLLRREDVLLHIRRTVEALGLDLAGSADQDKRERGQCRGKKGAEGRWDQASGCSHKFRNACSVSWTRVGVNSL